MLYRALRQPAGTPGYIRTPDRRVAIANLRERYRPTHWLLRKARVAVISVCVVLLFSVFQQRESYVAYRADAAGYDQALTLLRAECGDRACVMSLARARPNNRQPGPELAAAMRRLGLQTVHHDPYTGESQFASNGRGQTVLHRNPTPSAEQLRIRRNREREWGAHRTSAAHWTPQADGWFTSALQR